VSLRKQLTSYGLIGIVNTLITAVTILGLTWLGVEPILANVAGFALGLLNSFILNKRLTFKGAQNNSALPFLVSFGIAYSLNLAALIVSAPLTTVHVLLPQVAAMFTYNVVFFLLMKLWVFHGGAKPRTL
jgi:putative flippase GtrA